MYPEFRDLLSYTADRKFFVHVDTNALEMKESDFAGNRLKMNLLGLPLDGSNAFVHGLMRDHSKHFSCVIKAIKSANHHNIPIKINTVVSKKNIDDLERMLPLLRDYRISRWSLYEFWSLGDAGLVNSADYAISPNVFLEKALDLKSQCEFAVVEIGAIEARRHSYFFVTQAGRAYTVHPNDVSQYLELGSIFENDVLAKWQNVASYSDNAGRLGARVVN
jgi:MoaA/NifB/PqqE/SkfB family radical SAM enzyme